MFILSSRLFCQYYCLVFSASPLARSHVKRGNPSKAGGQDTKIPQTRKKQGSPVWPGCVGLVRGPSPRVLPRCFVSVTRMVLDEGRKPEASVPPHQILHAQVQKILCDRFVSRSLVQPRGCSLKKEFQPLCGSRRGQIDILSVAITWRGGHRFQSARWFSPPLYLFPMTAAYQPNRSCSLKSL